MRRSHWLVAGMQSASVKSRRGVAGGLDAQREGVFLGREAVGGAVDGDEAHVVGVVLGQLLGVEVGIVVAAVVDEHDFEGGGVVLLEQQGQQAAQVVELVAGAHHDGHRLGVGARAHRPGLRGGGGRKARRNSAA